MTTRTAVAASTSHAERIRDLLTDAGIDVVDVLPTPANPRIYRARVKPLSDEQRRAVLRLRKQSAQHGYGFPTEIVVRDSTDVIRVEAWG